MSLSVRYYASHRPRAFALSYQLKNSSAAVFKLYIAPAILIMPFRSNSANTALFFRTLSTVIWTFVRATASTIRESARVFKGGRLFQQPAAAPIRIADLNKRR